MELTEIVLTPTTNGSSSYRVTWTSSYYNTSRYMITVYPPESYTQEGLIHNTENSTVHNITVALKNCPHRIYSTFILGKIQNAYKCDCLCIIIVLFS